MEEEEPLIYSLIDTPTAAAWSAEITPRVTDECAGYARSRRYGFRGKGGRDGSHRVCLRRDTRAWEPAHDVPEKEAAT